MVVFRESVWSSNRQVEGKSIFSVSEDNGYRFSGVAPETWVSLEIGELLVELTYVHIPSIWCMRKTEDGVKRNRYQLYIFSDFPCRKTELFK